MVIVLIYGMSEIAIQEKAEEKNLQITGISSIEDTHLSGKKKEIICSNKQSIQISSKNRSRPYPERNDTTN